jgi:hypothetical protein
MSADSNNPKKGETTVTEKTRRVFDLCLEIDRFETERRELEASLSPEERDDLEDSLQKYADTQGSMA